MGLGKLIGWLRGTREPAAIPDALWAETLTTLHAVQGTPSIRRQLGLKPEQALLQLDEIFYSRTCKPVLCCQTCYTDFFDFAMVRKLV